MRILRFTISIMFALALSLTGLTYGQDAQEKLEGYLIWSDGDTLKFTDLFFEYEWKDSDTLCKRFYIISLTDEEKKESKREKKLYVIIETKKYTLEKGIDLKDVSKIVSVYKKVLVKEAQGPWIQSDGRYAKKDEILHVCDQVKIIMKNGSEVFLEFSDRGIKIGWEKLKSKAYACQTDYRLKAWVEVGDELAEVSTTIGTKTSSKKKFKEDPILIEIDFR